MLVFGLNWAFQLNVGFVLIFNEKEVLTGLKFMSNKLPPKDLGNCVCFHLGIRLFPGCLNWRN